MIGVSLLIVVIINVDNVHSEAAIKLIKRNPSQSPIFFGENDGDSIDFCTRN